MNKLAKFILFVLFLVVFILCAFVFSKCSCSNSAIKRPDVVKTNSDYVLLINNVK